jgi:hypothetical protein
MVNGISTTLIQVENIHFKISYSWHIFVKYICLTLNTYNFARCVVWFHRSMIFDDRGLRKIFGPKRVEVIGTTKNAE